MKNPAFGKWTVEDTNWSDKDSKYIKSLQDNSTGSKATSLKELIKLHKSLPY